MSTNWTDIVREIEGVYADPTARPEVKEPACTS
jgi:hypothetical protein